MNITEAQIRSIIREEIKKAAPFGSGMKQADLDAKEKDIIGHT